MLRTARSLIGTPVFGLDGELGELESFHFCDDSWTVHDLVVHRGLGGKRRLVPLDVIEAFDEEHNRIRVALDRAALERAQSGIQKVTAGSRLGPDVTLFYRRGFFWTHVADPHLRDSAQTEGSTVDAVDGHAGRLVDLVIDSTTWRIPALIVVLDDALANGAAVLVSPGHVTRIGWDIAKLWLDLDRAGLRACPSVETAGLLSWPGASDLAMLWTRWP